MENTQEHPAEEVITLGHTVIDIEHPPSDADLLARVADALRELP